MTLPVFYYDHASELADGAQVSLDGAEAHHAATVRRVRAGELIVLTDGRGVAATVEVIEAGRRELHGEVRAVQAEAAPGLRVLAVQALAKGDRGELAVELLTEVGVDAIVPWQAERSVSRWVGDKAVRGRAKWAATAASAAKQSRRLWWPTVSDPVDGSGVADLIRSADRVLILHEAADECLMSLLERDPLPEVGQVALVIGPEGGISEDELALLQTAGGALVRLGPTVLRSSTAGVVAASLVLARTAPWRSRLEAERRDSL
ncbi:MAG TPA: 16S rRNA (uracil(1498)-N(3))-methyltransferase [Actinomycetes bacterium]|nr:16S rRNA (uracil(1498)-N(3))-methyltransferase [Actinomycetes bacterium]